MVVGDIVGLLPLAEKKFHCAAVKYDSIFWTTDTKVKMKHCQRLIGPVYKQFAQPSHHAEIVADLLELPVSVSQEIQSNTDEMCCEPPSPDTTMSDKSNSHPLDLASMRAQYNVIRKRKRYRNISDEEIRGVGEEVELDPALFTQPEKNQSTSPRVFRSVRQRKKVKFASKSNEQEFYQYMPTYSVVAATFSKEAEELIDPHIPRRGPYVPDGEEVPEFIYSDDSDDLMQSIMAVTHEPRTPSTDEVIEVDENYEDSGSDDDHSDSSDDSGIFGQGMEGISPSKVTRIEGIESLKDDLDMVGEPGPTIESDVGDLTIENVFNKPISRWIVECPACGKCLSQNKLDNHLDAGCDGLFKAIVPDDDSVHEQPNLQSFNQTVACPMCQKFVVLEKINQHLDAKCKTFLAEDIIPKSNPGQSSTPLNTSGKGSKSILKDVSKDSQNSLKASNARPEDQHISFADDTAEHKLRRQGRRSTTPLPRWMREDPPLQPLTKIVEGRDIAKTNTELDKQISSFKGNIVPIGHSANAEEQDNTPKFNNKGKEVTRPSIHEEDEVLKWRRGNVRMKEKEASITVRAAREDADNNVEADDESERGRSKLRGGNATRKRSKVRSRSHGHRRRERSLTNHY